MFKVLAGVFVLGLANRAAVAQQVPPVLHATSPVVDIQDGDALLKGIWVADPALGLDVYDAIRTAKGKKVTFISDIDSVSFDVAPGRTYDFVIEIAGKDRCRTRLSTMAQACERAGRGFSAGPSVVPITISHGKLHLQGKFNDSETLDLIFDTGADICVLYPSAMEKGARLTFDGTISNTGTGGTTVRQVGRDNRIEVADCRWSHEPVMYVEKQADIADGIVGYRVFEDKVVEFDYDRMLMLVHESLPAHASRYVKTSMPRSGTLWAVEAVLVDGERESSGLFLLDTGGTGTMIVNQAFAAAHGLRSAMRKLGTSRSRGVGSGVIRHDLLLLPRLSLAGFAIQGVPINVEVPSDGGSAPPGGALCIDVLRRFNTILDFARSEAFFEPNTHYAEPFDVGVWARTSLLIVGLAGGVLVLSAAAVWRRSRSRAMATRRAVAVD